MRAPRLVTRTLVSSFLTVALVLGAVFAMLSIRVREQVRQSVADNLASAQQVFQRVEARRQQDVRAAVATLAENPDAQGGARHLAERARLGERAHQRRAVGHGAARVRQDGGTRRRRRAGRHRCRRPHRGQQRPARRVVAARRDCRGAHQRDGRDRSLGERGQRRVSRDQRAAAAGRGDDRVARARHRARRRATRASSRTCRAAMPPSCRGPMVLASTLSGPAARDLATYLGDAVTRGAARSRWRASRGRSSPCCGSAT